MSQEMIKQMTNDTTELHIVKVLDNKLISSSSRILSFKKEFSFHAGQVIGITNSPLIPPRLYSISSSIKDAKIEILYKVVHQGKLTPALDRLKKGDTLFITPPFGKFIASRVPSCYVATGTGLAPFLSMIRSGIGNCRKLLHGSRETEDFYEADYLKNQLGKNYIQCYSGLEEFIGFRGRVTDYLNEASDLNKVDKYYLCGSAEMVVEARELLIGKGIPFQNILSEIYF